MEIKEVIQAKIDLLLMIIKGDCKLEFADLHFSYLSGKLEQAKSIEDIQRAAFNAGRNKINNPNFDPGEDEAYEMFMYEYNRFEDYLKSIKNE